MRVKGNKNPDTIHIEAYLPKAGYVELRLTENVVQLEENLYQYDEYVLQIPQRANLAEEIEANLSDWLITGRTLEVNENASEMADRKATMDVLGVSTPAQAEAKQAAITTAGAMLTDEQALEVIELYDEWKPDVAYEVDNRVRYEEKLYKCLQAHTSQADWNPEATPALWVEIAAPGEYREIKDNMLSTEAFALDEIGWYKTKDNLYKSLIANNVYTPDSYPAGWEKVED
jgi:acyl transferase domain-containing protein